MFFSLPWRFYPSPGQGLTLRGFAITLRHTTFGRTPLEEGSALSQRPLPDNTQYSQQTAINVLGGFRTRRPSKRAAAEPRLRPRGSRDRQSSRRNSIKFGVGVYRTQVWFVSASCRTLDWSIQGCNMASGVDVYKSLCGIW